jgi:histidinol-phosphatase (PHP family)
MQLNHLVIMPWANFHSHSVFCDGKALPEEFIKRAIEKGFPAYGCSSHAPVPFDSVWNMQPAKLPEYFRELNRIRKLYSGEIQVYTGLEVDYIEGIWGCQASGLRTTIPDFLIGSVHYIGQYNNGSYFCFDGGPEAFFRGIEQIYQNDFKKAISAYYHSVIGMAETDRPDIIGHLDKIKMHNSIRPYLSEEDKWYTNLVEDTLEVILQNGCMVEVNTRGLYKHNPPILYPGPWILKRLQQKKIPVVISSDAHHPDEIESGFGSAAALLHDIGFKTVMVLLDGKWQEKPFDEKGMIF